MRATPSSEPTTPISENKGVVLDDAALEGRRLVSPDELAAYLSVAVDWVYSSVDLLEPRRLGKGSKPRLRFSIPAVDRALTCSGSRGSEVAAKPEAKPISARRRTRPTSSSASLLPIRGRETPREAA